MFLFSEGCVSSKESLFRKAPVLSLVLIPLWMWHAMGEYLDSGYKRDIMPITDIAKYNVTMTIVFADAMISQFALNCNL